MKKILSIIAISLSTVLFAQNVEFEKENFKDNKDGLKEAKSNIKQGDEISLQGPSFYKDALAPYLAAQSFNPNNAVLNFKIGRAYTYSQTKLKAIPYLEKAFELNPTVDPQIHYYLGKAYHLNMQWDKAIEAFNLFLKNSKPEDRKELFPSAEKHIEECKVGKKLQENPIRVFIDNAGQEINSQSPDYGPVINADESVMLFTSRRSSTTGGLKDEYSNEYMEDIYSSTSIKGRWGIATNMPTPINTQNHDAISGVSADGQKLLIYIGSNNGDLFESVLKGDVWSKPEGMGKNINTGYHESSACYSPDGKSVYFVSDNPDNGGFGDRDIYISTKDEKGRWGTPFNLGGVINTKYGEEGAYIHPDGKTLYFSSQGHESMGGYDIFKSIYDAGTKTWSKPVNLGYPVNTTDDDVFFVVSASGRHGYYSSFQESGYGEKDIYMITFLGPEKPMGLDNEDNLLANRAAPVKEVAKAQPIAISEAMLTVLKGVITDALSQKPLEATIEIVDNERNESIATFSSNSSTGKYLVTLPAGKNYGIAVKKENYLFHSENFIIPITSAYQEVTKDIALKNISVGTKIVLRNIFFDTGKSTLRKESTNELARLHKLLSDMPTLKIEISGHTDSKGSADLNQKLSEARAKAVVDYLIKAGIPSDRLTYKGYGKEQPVASNESEEGRQLNRRTEFTVLGN